MLFGDIGVEEDSSVVVALSMDTGYCELEGSFVFWAFWTGDLEVAQSFLQITNHFCRWELEPFLYRVSR